MNDAAEPGLVPKDVGALARKHGVRLHVNRVQSPLVARKKRPPPNTANTECACM